MNTNAFHPNCTIVIVTYTNTKGLVALLQDIYAYEPQYPIVIINNNTSQDLTQSLIKVTKNLKIKIIQENQNDGFAKASNKGARVAQQLYNPDYLIFLNDDIRFDRSWTQRLIKTMNKNSWQIIAPLLRKPSGQVENYGFKILPKGKIEELKSKNLNIDGLTGAALIFKTDTYFSLGGYDERFFAYLEDVDLFIRAKKRNIQFGLTDDVTLTHVGQQTSTHMSTFKAWLDLRNWIYLIGKNWGFGEIIKYFPQIMVERLRNLSGLIKSLPHLKS